MTKEELAAEGELIKSAAAEVATTAATEATTKFITDLETLAKAEADPEAPAAAVTEPEAPAAAPLAKDAPVAPAVAVAPTETAPAATVEDLMKSLTEPLKVVVTEAVDAAVSPLRDEVEALSKAAAPGGPRVSIPGAGRSSDGSTGEVDLTQMKERLEKSTDPVEKAELGRRITHMQLLGTHGIKVKD